jgi:hypothetical protein
MSAATMLTRVRRRAVEKVFMLFKKGGLDPYNQKKTIYITLIKLQTKGILSA